MPDIPDAITDAIDDLGGIWEQEQVLAKLFFSQNNKSHDQTLSLTADFFLFPNVKLAGGGEGSECWVARVMAVEANAFQAFLEKVCLVVWPSTEGTLSSYWEPSLDLDSNIPGWAL